MSDKEATNQWDANEGITLPSNITATYDIALSPLFITRSGRGSWNTKELSTEHRGTNGFLRPSTATNIENAYYLVGNQEIIHPSGKTLTNTPLSLRCLVSTNNRLMINLVSDDGNNLGTTLPANGATNNIGLSPLFINRTSNIYPWNQGLAYRGQDGHYWSKASRPGLRSYFLHFSPAHVYPNYSDSSAQALSLRCLVSTNNR